MARNAKKKQWSRGKGAERRLLPLAQLMSALLRLHAQRQTIRVLGQVQALRPKGKK